MAKTGSILVTYSEIRRIMFMIVYSREQDNVQCGREVGLAP